MRALLIALAVMIGGCDPSSQKSKPTSAPPPLASTDTVAMIGDSLTAQGNWKAYCGTAANHGVNSDTTRGVLSRLPAIEARKYRVASVLIGVNDIAKDIPTDETVRNVRAIVDRLRASGSSVILISLLPVTAKYPRPDFNEKINRLRTALATVAGATKVQFSIPERLYQADGIHLEPAAYRIWWDAIRNRVDCPSGA